MTGLSQHLPALQVVVPMLSAPVIMLLHPRGLAWAAATAVSLFAFAIAVMLTLGVLDGQDYRYFMGSWPAPYGIELGVDAFSALLLLVVTGASALALLACRRSLDADIEAERQPLFYAAWMLALAGLVGILVSADAFNIFVFMEISSLASYVLIAGGPDRRALPAVFKYLIMGTIGATFYLIGIGLIYMMTGTLNLADRDRSWWRPASSPSALRLKRPCFRCTCGCPMPTPMHRTPSRYFWPRVRPKYRSTCCCASTSSSFKRISQTTVSSFRISSCRSQCSRF